MSLTPPPDTAAEAWHPTYDQLAPWAKVLAEQHYAGRVRARCSREDFMSGFIDCFVALRWRSAFRDDFAWPGWPPNDYEVPPVVRMMADAGPRSVLGAPVVEA